MYRILFLWSRYISRSPNDDTYFEIFLEYSAKIICLSFHLLLQKMFISYDFCTFFYLSWGRLLISANSAFLLLLMYTIEIIATTNTMTRTKLTTITVTVNEDTCTSGWEPTLLKKLKNYATLVKSMILFLAKTYS